LIILRGKALKNYGERSNCFWLHIA
jgi:hypothetical protein